MTVKLSARSPREATATARKPRLRSAISRRLLATADSGFEIEIIGVRRAAQRLSAPAFDPQGKRMRS